MATLAMIIGLAIMYGGKRMVGQDPGWDLTGGRATWDPGFEGMFGCLGAIVGGLLMAGGCVMFFWGLLNGGIDVIGIIEALTNTGRR